ncbi:acyl-CoA thioesterase/BAAT N-terminal domain-containing protein [Leifsonia sp. NPDC058248]|uniref:acyl-CoA thioesterase/BAAT N-terminal domain-containing protein n=1 Tax=Leifsonia sp. NPDC058248 TaxID=3346402 RepID=UPI0036DFA3E5
MRWRERRRTGRAAIAVACGLIAALVLTACVAGRHGRLGPRFVTPPLIHYTSVLWPVPLQLVGVEPGSRIRLEASLDTGHGRWSSSATYTVPASGTVDLATAKPQLAAFTEPDSAGLFWSLRGPDIDPSDLMQLWMRSTVSVAIDAQENGRVVASREFVLDGLGSDVPPITVSAFDIADAAEAAGEDFPSPRSVEDIAVGAYFSARSAERPRRPVVIVFDDPAVGASSDYVGPLLSQFGAAVFVLPVRSTAPGVYAASVIDSSKFGAVLDWLIQRPEVDGRHIFTYGTSQSAQFALWAATRFSDRVAGVFAAGGATAMLCLRGAHVPPVFENGARTPCQRGSDRIVASRVLPLRSVSGPVVAACAGRDEVLPNACAWLEAAIRDRGQRAGDTIVRAPESVHAMTVPPGLPIALPEGAAAQATEKARVAFWDAVGGVLLRAAQR